MKPKIYILTCLLSLCFIHISSAQRIKGSGPIVKQELGLKNFHSINMNSSLDVQLTQGNSQSVVAEGNANIIERIKTNVKNGMWSIELMNGNYSFKKLTIYITIPNLEQVKINGSGDVEASRFEVDDLDIHIGGSGDVVFKTGVDIENDLNIHINGSGDVAMKDVNVKSTTCTVSGSGDIHLSGYTDAAQYRISGTGDVDAMSFKSEEVNVNINGSGDVKVHVNRSLDINVNGSGDVYYRGNANVKSKMNGSGDIHHQN
jgi:hypothetical protein